jgi:hypothetical protein
MYRKTVIALTSVLAVSLPAAAAGDPLMIFDTANALVGPNLSDGPGSSDITLILRLQSSGGIHVDEGDVVSYLVDTAPAEGWTQIAFDESGWEAGVSGVGYGDGDDNTDVGSGKFVIITRYTFDIPGAASISSLELLADYDDQYAAWLNGTLIAVSPGVASMVSADAEPAHNITEGGSDNNGATELAAGSPNEARWSDASIDTNGISFVYGGSAAAVEARGKLTTAWAALKTR